jgi:hypothetical protein
MVLDLGLRVTDGRLGLLDHRRPHCRRACEVGGSFRLDPKP